MKTIATATTQTSNVHYKTSIQTGDFALIADEPVHAGGQNAGPAPYDYLLAGLGACTSITLQMYAERKDWNLGELTIELNLQKDSEGNTHIERVLHTTEILSTEQQEKLLDIAGKTPVTKTLLQGASINTQYANS